MNKVVIVGCGNVGMSYAYAIVTRKLNVDEIVLIDINKEKAEGEALDLSHACACTGRHIKIKAGSYKECDNATIVCIAAGRNQEVGETRTDLIEKNYHVFKSIISEINKTKFKGIYLVATNPLDVMTYITKKLSGFPANKVIGSGTTLDTARLKYLISEKLNINSREVHAYVIGEHGDTEFIPWKNALIGPNNVDCFLTANEMNEILVDVRNSAYEIIAKKGNTAYGIGMCLEDISRAIINNEKSIFTVSAYNRKHDVYFGIPTVLGSKGAEKSLFFELTPKEENQLLESINRIKENVKSIEDK